MARSSGRRAMGGTPAWSALSQRGSRKPPTAPPSSSALTGDVGKGSARSVAGVDLGAAIQRIAAEGLLIKGGGHRMAAGLTVARDHLEAAMERLADLLARQGAGASGPRDLRLDGLLMPGAASPALIEEIDRAGPFGQGAPAPRFAFPSVAITQCRRIGESHLKISFSDGSSPAIDGIAFGAFDGPLGPFVEAHGGLRMHLAGKLELNHWNGRTRVQMRLDDAARP
jgi:single-stranded-DNA-specific exonuclease